MTGWRRRAPRPSREAGRRQVDVLARAFEAGAFDAFVRVTGRQPTDPRRVANEDAALAAVEEFLGEPLLPQTTRSLRAVLGRDALGRPPSYGAGDATTYLRWLVTADVDKARKRREGERRRSRK